MRWSARQELSYAVAKHQPDVEGLPSDWHFCARFVRLRSGTLRMEEASAWWEKSDAFDDWTWRDNLDSGMPFRCWRWHRSTTARMCASMASTPVGGVFTASLRTRKGVDDQDLRWKLMYRSEELSDPIKEWFNSRLVCDSLAK